jgi:tRNA (guanine26-N2/guanine27-N2)-dimethyltransferase
MLLCLYSLYCVGSSFSACIEACKRNIKFNGASAMSKIEPHLTDARVYMLTHPKEFDVVDIDPYGAPSIFLDSAVQAVADGGLLMCTATDMAVLCGPNGEVCHSKYGSYPTKGKYNHEMALRILLASIESHANRYKRYIVPVLSVSMDFYIRVFVRVFT